MRATQLSLANPEFVCEDTMFGVLCYAAVDNLNENRVRKDYRSCFGFSNLKSNNLSSETKELNSILLIVSHLFFEALCNTETLSILNNFQGPQTEWHCNKGVSGGLRTTKYSLF